MRTLKTTILSALCAITIAAFSTTANAEAVPVELVNVDGNWQLLRDGEPYHIRGAGGTGPLDQLAAAGANSVRVWSTDNIDPILDEAHSLGLTVAVGIWLGHERHGFDYSDKKQVKDQLEMAREAVLRYKDHPAVLLWGVGNEMEGFEDGDDPRVWSAVNEVAAMIKEIDPNHPTMTVTAEIGGGRIEMVHNQTPAIDIHGINTYGGSASIGERLEAGGASKPFVITEFGPMGPWEAPTAEWGAPFEQTSTEKAESYRSGYQKSILDRPGKALGAYAFLWGHKMEGTATWFGMLLEDGSKTSVLDTMSELWTGEAPADLSPSIERVSVEGETQLDPNAEIVASTSAVDPEGQPVTLRWVLQPESGDYHTGGDFRPSFEDIEEAIVESADGTVRVRMPEEPGGYRLFAYATDPAGNSATANIPLLVKGVPRPRMPISVYEERFEHMPWAASGVMGSTRSLTIDDQSTEFVHEGSTSLKVSYTGRRGWAGLAWQDPPNNWGEMEGGFDMTGAGALEFWVRGEKGGEEVSFGIGLLDEKTDHPDSVIIKTPKIKLGTEWKRFRIGFQPGDDLTSIKVPFVITIEGRGKPTTIYVDSVRFVK